jgi:hypothetical protein
MEETQSRPSRVYLATSKPKIPNKDLRDFIIGVEALLGLGGTFRDGFVTAGLPNTCPYSDEALGYGVNGNGTLGAAREQYAAWHAIGDWHRGICAAFYRGPRSEKEIDALSSRVVLSEEITKAAKNHEQYAGVLVVMGLAGKKLSRRAAELEVETAHVAWVIELSNAEAAGDCHWKTGVL